MENNNVFWNVFIYKTGVGTTGIVRADSLSETAERVAKMTKECVTFVVRAANVEISDYGLVIFDNVLREIQ